MVPMFIIILIILFLLPFAPILLPIAGFGLVMEFLTGNIAPDLLARLVDWLTSGPDWLAGIAGWFFGVI